MLKLDSCLLADVRPCLVPLETVHEFAADTSELATTVISFCGKVYQSSRACNRRVRHRLARAQHAHQQVHLGHALRRERQRQRDRL